MALVDRSVLADDLRMMQRWRPLCPQQRRAAIKVLLLICCGSLFLIQGQNQEIRESIEQRIERAMQYGVEGQHEEAYASFRSAFDMASERDDGMSLFNSTSLNNFGLAAHRSGRGEEALDLFRMACSADSSFCSELSVMLKQAGLFAEAKSVLTDAIHRAPDDPNLWLSAGLTLLSAGEYGAAVSSFTIARRLDPSNSKLLVNEGQALIQAGDKGTGRDRLLSASRLAPSDAKPHLMLVDLYSTWDQPKLVAAHLNKALAADPEDPAALEAYATLMSRIGQYETALNMRRKLVRKRPYDLLQRCKLVQLAQSVVAWDDYETHIPVVLAELRARPLQTRDCLQPLETAINSAYSELDLQRVTRLWAEELIWTVPGATAVRQELGPLSIAPWAFEKGRFGVGYLSSNLQGGAVFLMVQGLWRAHAVHSERHLEAKGRILVRTYSTVPLDPSNDKAESYAELERYSTVTALPYPADRIASAKAIRGDRVQVLVNVNGWCDQGANELLAARLAPVQVSMMGYPGSMGSSDWTDLLVSDSIASPPEHERHFTEKLLLLPESYYLNDFKFRLPHIGQWRGREDCGTTRADSVLPAQAFVFASFNRPEKIDREIFECWMRILLATPNSVLWLLRDVKGRGPASGAPHLVEDSLRKAAARAGVDLRRLQFASPVAWREHVKRGALADLFLDTPAYNAHSTGCNSLWAGVPILTYPHIKMPSRVAAGMNRAASLSLYTARTLQDYQDMAVALGTRPLAAEKLRRQVMAGREGAWLFDTEGMVGVLERGFAIAWEVWLATGTHMHVIPTR